MTTTVHRADKSPGFVSAVNEALRLTWGLTLYSLPDGTLDKVKMKQQEERLAQALEKAGL